MDSSVLTSTLSQSAHQKVALAKASVTANGQSKDAALKAAKEFESVFLTNMLEGMFEGVKTDGPFGGGHSEKVYRSLMVGEYAKEMSANGGLGIADQVYRELLAIQEASQR